MSRNANKLNNTGVIFDFPEGEFVIGLPSTASAIGGKGVNANPPSHVRFGGEIDGDDDIGGELTISDFYAFQDGGGSDGIAVVLSAGYTLGQFNWSLYNSVDDTTWEGIVSDESGNDALYFEDYAYGLYSTNDGAGETATSFVLTGTLISNPSIQVVGTTMSSFDYGT